MTVLAVHAVYVLVGCMAAGLALGIGLGVLLLVARR